MAYKYLAGAIDAKAATPKTVEPEAKEAAKESPTPKTETGETEKDK